MKPKRIILIRHGESEGNVDKKNYEIIPDYALGLTPTGIFQSQAAGMLLRGHLGTEKIRVYLSPYRRTRQTWDNISKFLEGRVTKVVEDPRLREQDWGHLQNVKTMKETVRQRDNFSTFYYRIADGESGADVFDRISTFLDTLHRDFEKEDYPENALIVTHGMTLRLFLMRWFHWTVEEFQSVRNPKNCQMVVMENREGKYFLRTELKRRIPKEQYENQSRSL